jgi:hypothetical protein
MVFAYFMEPDYETILIKKKKDKKNRQKKKLNKLFIDFYTVNANYPIDLFYKQNYSISDKK